MVKALVLFAHPCLHRVAVGSIRQRGSQFDDCDLSAEGVSPVLPTEERRGYHQVGPNTAPVQTCVDRLRTAEALVLVFPVWNFGFPDILKGFFNRVFLPGVSFRLKDGFVRPNLTHICTLATVTTYGGTRIRAVLAGDPPRRVVRRAVWHVCRPDKLRYLALYDMNRATEERRRRFLMAVQREMEAL